jgi:hypothetical protein
LRRKVGEGGSARARSTGRRAWRRRQRRLLLCAVSLVGEGECVRVCARARCLVLFVERERLAQKEKEKKEEERRARSPPSFRRPPPPAAAFRRRRFSSPPPNFLSLPTSFARFGCCLLL